MTHFIYWTLWDLWLAAMPVGLGYSVAAVEQAARRRRSRFIYLILIVLFALWLAFLPNTCYLLTEWRHFLEQVDRADLYQRAEQDHVWLFYISTLALFYLCFSGFGLLALTLSIRPIERILRRWGQPFYRVAPFLFTLLSIGVYMGLILRFNSWDLWNRPRVVWHAIAEIPGNLLLVIAIVAFALLLWALYEGLDIWVDGIEQRLEARRARRRA